MRFISLGALGALLLATLLLSGCGSDEDITTLVAEANAACTQVSFNGRAESGDMSGWTLTANGPDPWVVCAPGQFCTSYSWARKERTIDLLAAGVPLFVLDAGQAIHVSESFAMVFPQTMTYNLGVTLLDSAMVPIASWSTGDTPTTTDATAAHVFSGYHTPGNPVRHLRWADGGRDGLSWAGYYGPRLYGATLAVGNRCK